MRTTQFIITTLLLSMAALLCEGRVKGHLVCSEIHTPTEIVTATDSFRIKLPKKHEKLLVVNNAYTKREAAGRSFAGNETDSVIIWMPTKPEITHTMVCVEPYGWCWQLEKSHGIALYAFSSKGYRMWGNGGMAAGGKFIIVLVKNGTTEEFRNTHKMSDEKFRKRLAAIVSDDPVLADMILKSRTRRDKTLRMVRLYKPVF